MRKAITLMSLALLGVLLIGYGSVGQAPNYEQGELDGWQAVAETYYTEEGLANENFFFEAPDLVAAGELDARYAYRQPDLIQNGLIVPDFTLLDMEGVPHSLSDYRGEKFVLLTNGSWY